MLENYSKIFNVKFSEKFSWRNKLFWVVLFAFFCLRLFWAAKFPMTNDEVYYWDWSRAPQLSYFDAPPMVAWVSYIGSLFSKTSLGARLLLPFMHVISSIFIIKSTHILANLKNTTLKNSHIFYILLLTQVTPVFNLEGFLLLPDASLLLGISGSLYFLLKYIAAGTRALGNGLFFGIFLGIAALSKYHALPIAIGFFIAFLLIPRITNAIKNVLFWATTILMAIVVSSPVFIWNLQNHFASFVFQSQHGYSEMSINFRAFGRYILGVLFYLLPWFCIPLIQFSLRSIFRRSKSIANYDLVCAIPFLIIFSLILFSALGKQALPHWAMPGFYLLIPAFILQWNPLEGKRKNIWKNLFIISTILTTLLPTLSSLDSFQYLFIKTFVSLNGNADPLAQALLWKNLENELKKQENISIPTKQYSNTDKCDTNEYKIASLRWYWTAQIAFYFHNQPKVFNFDLSNPSFYTWRDSAHKLKGCRFIIIGSQDHFNETALRQIMDIEKIKAFSLKPFDGEKIVTVEGVYK